MAGNDDATASHSRRLGVAALHLAVLALLLVLGWNFARRLDFGLLRSRLGEVEAVAFAWMTLGLLARLPVWTARWQTGIRGAGLEASPIRMVGAIAASMAVNTITPTARVAGGLVRARYLAADARCGFGIAYGTVLVDQLAHHAAMSVASFAAFVFMARGRLPGWVIAAVILASIAVLAIVVASYRGGRGGSRSLLDRWLARVRHRLDVQAARQPRLGAALAGGGDAIEVVARLLRMRRVLAASAVYGAALFLLNGWTQWLAFRALDLEIGLGAALAVVAVGGFAGVVSGTPGGAGGAEAAMIASLAALGVSRVDATAATLLFRGLHYAVTLGVGLPSLAALEWLQRSQRSRAAA